MSRARELADQHKTLDVDGGTIKLDGNYPVGTGNVALGDAALDDGSLSGNYNTAIGNVAMTANTTGGGNVAVGGNALDANTTASSNTAVGYDSLTLNTTGAENTAIGRAALASNTTANNNTGVGYGALQANTTGSNNAAVGYNALVANTTGTQNVALGFALATNTTGSENSAVGWGSLYYNTTGSYNTAMGRSALLFNTASNNTAVGYQAGYSNTTGEGNTFIGLQTGYYTTGDYNTFIGPAGPNGASGANITTGSKNTIVGAYNGNQGGLDIRTASNNIVLSDGDGNPRIFVDNGGNIYHSPSNTQYGIWAGNFNAASGGYTLGYGTSTGQFRNIYASNNGGVQLNFHSGANVATLSPAGVWTNASDARLKTNIRDIEYGLSTVVATQPRHFERVDVNGTYIGFVAQELQNVIPEVVSGDPDTQLCVDYGSLIAVAFKAIQEQQETITALTARIEALEA
jgi:hypothetical protein